MGGVADWTETRFCEASQRGSSRMPGYRDLSPLAGLCGFEEARRTNLSVEDCVAWMKRHHYLLLRLHEIFTARITAEPIYELKTAFSHHAYLCAEHVATLRKRVSELREPPLGLDLVPHEGLRLCFDEILASPSHVELVLGIYEIVIPRLIDSLAEYRATTNPLADAPSVRLARFCELEMEDLRAFGKAAVNCLVTDADRTRLADWVNLLHAALDAAGGISGLERGIADAEASPLAPGFAGERARERGEPSVTTHTKRNSWQTAIQLPPPMYCAQPYRYDPVPRRDERFRDSYNGGVNPEAFLYDERFSPRDKTLMLFYKRLREIDVPEMMASIIQETRGKPWDYVLGMSRQLWDEARHAMLGEVGFVDLGVDWSQIPVNFTWSLNLNTQLAPIERHAVLFFIEQTLMPKMGKRYEWEIGRASGNALAALIQDFDWADEVLHAQLGREWYVKDFGDLQAALDYGDKCWSKVMSHWRKYQDEGLTDHRNWWPDLYAAACRKWNVPPDPAALKFATTYEDTRADLKNISASA
jgi:hypothetical protein